MSHLRGKKNYLFFSWKIKKIQRRGKINFLKCNNKSNGILKKLVKGKWQNMMQRVLALKSEHDTDSNTNKFCDRKQILNTVPQHSHCLWVDNHNE